MNFINSSSAAGIVSMLWIKIISFLILPIVDQGGLRCCFVAAVLHPSSSSSPHKKILHQQIYLDVEPVDSSRFLEIIKELKLSSYQLANEKGRKRIGFIGPEIAEMVPEAVELVPKRVLPPLEKGGEPIVHHNVPVVNENLLFMMSIGATQELIKRLNKINESVSQQFHDLSKAIREVAKLEYLLSQSSNEESELRIKSSIAQAEILQSQVELEIQRAHDEKNYIEEKKQMDVAQIKRHEELTTIKIMQEDEAARRLARKEMEMKVFANRIFERTKSDAMEALSNAQHTRDIALQKLKEELKIKSAQDIAKAKAEAERANEDVHIRKLKAEAEQKRKRNIAAINAIANHIASTFRSASNNPKYVLACIWYAAILSTGIYTSREIARLCRAVIESTIGKPKLVRETSRKKLPLQFLDLFVKNCWDTKRGGDCKTHGQYAEEVFSDVVLEDALKQRVLSIVKSANKVRKNNAPYRHVLFFGPPGTGKTMVAKKMAQSIGMDYALMSGGDVGPLGNDAVTQIHNLFRWASYSRKGVLLFIDEAECFLGDRGKIAMSEAAHNALNALLYNTGTERQDFMMVLATNRAEDLDASILDRCDESLCFSLPGESCRRRLILEYFGKFVKSLEDDSDVKKQNSIGKLKHFFSREVNFRAIINQDVMNETQLDHFVRATDGFSGREIAKLMISLQGAIYSSIDGKLDYNLAANILKLKIREHTMKAEMRGANDITLHGKQYYCSRESPLTVKQSTASNGFHQVKHITSQFRDVSSTYDDITDEDFSCETKSNICSKENDFAGRDFPGKTVFPSKVCDGKSEGIGTKCTCDLM